MNVGSEKNGIPALVFKSMLPGLGVSVGGAMLYAFKAEKISAIKSALIYSSLRSLGLLGGVYGAAFLSYRVISIEEHKILDKRALCLIASLPLVYLGSVCGGKVVSGLNFRQVLLLEAMHVLTGNFIPCTSTF